MSAASICVAPLHPTYAHFLQAQGHWQGMHLNSTAALLQTRHLSGTAFSPSESLLPLLSIAQRACGAERMAAKKTLVLSKQRAAEG